MSLYINVFLPIIAGLVFLVFKKVRIYLLSVVLAVLCLLSSMSLFFSNNEVVIRWIKILNLNIILSNDIISSLNVFLVSFFAFIVIVFSKEVLKDIKENTYFSFIFFILAFTNLIFFSKNLIVLLIFWEILGVVVYLMIRFINKNDEYAVATKTLTILSITDFCLLLGIVLLFINTNKFTLGDFNLNVKDNTLIFTLLVIGSLGKVGCVPFHNWIPDVAEKLPSALSGYLIGALDKIIGFYLLVRILKDIFILTQHTFLMVLGALTILIAVFMALNQHNLKKLLSYHAISQVGYIILGISTGTTLGIIGGIFHMINNTIYKTLLFLSSDVVEKTTGDVELSNPKGLAKVLPYSFVFTLIAALSISGIPPFNGFFSKWLIYQAVVERITTNKSFIIILVLISAMFGSALTLASFVKVVHSLFLSKPLDSGVQIPNNKYEKFYSIFPMGILAFLCLIFGIFAYEIPIKNIISPMLNIKDFSIIGNWDAKVAFYLMILGFVLGIIIYLLLVDKPRKVKNYVLAEEEKLKDSTIPATDFYLTIVETYPFSIIYHFAEQKLLDFYNWFYGFIYLLSLIIKSLLQLEIFDVYIFGKKIIFKIGENFSKLHSGNLHSYLSWIFLSIAILLLILLL